MVDSNAEMTNCFVLSDLLRDIIINIGVSKKPNIVHENTTIENTLPLLIRAIITEVRATMNVILVMVLCSSVENSCMPPITYPTVYEDSYTCMVDGYQKSLNQTISNHST